MKNLAMSTPEIRVDIRDNIASVEIYNPNQHNALTKDMCLQIVDMMPVLERDSDVKVVALRGAGTAFCAGAAINELPSVLLDKQDDNTTIDHLSNADQSITSMSKPTVALVDGACMGGGWQIASACDFIIASDRSKFAITPAKLGIIYPRQGIERLTRLVGPARAKYILLTAKTFSASQAHALGLVAEVITQSEFDEAGSDLLLSLRSRSQFSIHTMKHLVDLIDVDDPQVDQEWESSWAAMAEGPDMEIGISAFSQGVQPHFIWSPESDTPASLEP